MPDPVPGQNNKEEEGFSSEKVEALPQFLEPRQTLDMLIQTQKEGLASGFNQEISHENLMPLSASFGSIKVLPGQAIRSEIKETLTSFYGTITPLMAGNVSESRMAGINSVDELEVVLQDIHNASETLESLFEKFREEAGADEAFSTDLNDKFKIKTCIDVSHSSCVENLLMALRGVESGHKILLAGALAAQINHLVEDTSIDPALIGTREITLLSYLTGIDMIEGANDRQRSEAHRLIQAGLQESGGKGLDYLKNKGFRTSIELPEDLSVNESLFRFIIASKVIPQVLNSAIKASIDEDNPEQRDGYLTVAYDEEKQDIVFKFSVRPEHVNDIRARHSRRPEMPKSTDRKESAWGPFFRRLVFDRNHREYCEPIAPEITEDSQGQSVATVRIPYLG